MSRRQRLSLLLGCALVLCLEAPRAREVLAGDLARAGLLASAPAPAALAFASPALASPMHPALSLLAGPATSSEHRTPPLAAPAEPAPAAAR